MPAVGMLRLFERSDGLYIDQPSTGSCVRIDKSTGQLTSSKAPEGGPGATDLYGLAGVLECGGVSHVVAVAEAECVATVLGHRWMRAKRFSIHATGGFSQSPGKHGGTEARYTEAYLSMFRAVLESESFYFSLSMDLTRPVQRCPGFGAAAAGPSPPPAPTITAASRDFTWNTHLAGGLVAAGFENFVVPLMYGFVVSSDRISLSSTGREVRLVLVSRRSRRRPGCRFATRGADSSGYVANYVETEQIAIVDRGKEVFSHLQVRGSIPVHWSQPVCLKYAPPIVVGDPDRSAVAGRAHFDRLIRRHGTAAVVSLVNLKGAELAMAGAFQSLMARLAEPRAPFFPFDFHKECSKMRYERLAILTERIAGETGKHGWFHARGAASLASAAADNRLASTGEPAFAEVVSTQRGVVRVNCMDCLDRTNVFQSVIARDMLAAQLSSVGAIPKGHVIVAGKGSNAPVADAALSQAFKLMWADNGDAVSRQYSGTGALKADFTRTGKRSLMGYVEDGQKSLTRYYLNNLRDGERQDALELFLGIVAPAVPPQGGDSRDPFELRRRTKSSLTASLVAVLCLFLAFLGSVFAIPGGMGGMSPGSDPGRNDAGIRTVRTASWAAFWFLCLFVAVRAVQKNGRSLVDLPRFSLLPQGPEAPK